MPLWNGGSSSSSGISTGLESFSGATIERSRLGQQQQPTTTNKVLNVVSTTADDETSAAVSVETLEGGESGVSCGPHDSAKVATLNVIKSGRQVHNKIGDEDPQLTNSKKYAMADETTTIVVITEEIPQTASASAAISAPAVSKSYLRRLGDYLSRRRLRTTSSGTGGEGGLEEHDIVDGGGEQQQQQVHLEKQELSNVIFSDTREDKVMMKAAQGNFVICEDVMPTNKAVSVASTIQDSSDISDLDVDAIVNRELEEEDEEEDLDEEVVVGASVQVPKANSNGGYMLPRVFLNKEGTTVKDHDERRRGGGGRSGSGGSQEQQPFKLHQNGETTSNSVSNSGSERGGADNKSSGYCSSNLYSSGSIEEHIYSEPLPVVIADIVPRIIIPSEAAHVIDVEDDSEGMAAATGDKRTGHKPPPPLLPLHHQKKLQQQQKQQQASAMRVMGSTNSHNSNYSSDKIIITDESENVDEDDDDDEDGRRRCFGAVTDAVVVKGMVVEEDDDDDEEQYESPLVYRATDSIFKKRLPPAHRPPPPPPLLPLMTKAFSFNGPRSIPAPPPPPPPPFQSSSTLPILSLLPASSSTSSVPHHEVGLDKIPSQGNNHENGLRRASAASSSRKLPTIMEGIDGQIPRPIWPCDMDDSLMDINFESFLYSNEKRESPSTGGGGGVGQQKQIQKRASVGGARPNDIENNYRCMKYLNSCPENPYLVEGVEDLQMSVDKSLALYLKKCDDSLTMQNTRDFLEDIRGKLNVLLENHAQHAQVQLRSKSDSMVYHKSVALIERQIEKLKFDLDSYLKLFNQPNELQIKQLCTGLAKDARIQTLQNAIENRNNSLRNGSGQRSERGSMVSLLSSSSLAAMHDPTIGLVSNRLPFNASLAGNKHGSTSVVMIDEDTADDNNLSDDNELMNNYDTMRDQQQHQHWAQNVAIISQYPENDLSSYFDTVYVQDGFNMGYKVNNIKNEFDGPSIAAAPVVLRGKYVAPTFYNNRRPGSVVSSSSAVAMQQQQQRQTNNNSRRSNDSNYNSIASSADPNFRLKRNPSLSLSIASHNYSDRHPILASRDYEKAPHEIVTTTTTDDSLIGSQDTDSLNSSYQQRRGEKAGQKDGHLHQNMIMQQQSGFHEARSGSAEEARKSIASVDRQDLIQEWHKNRPSIWELYYGINRPKQSSMMGKKTGKPLVVKSGKKKKAAIPYPSTRPESDFTLDVPRAEQLQLKMKKAKKFRNRCRIVTSFLSLIFFLLTVMVVSLVLTRGKRMFGSMI